MREMAEAEIAWVAGLLEGEGCFHLSWRTKDNGTHYPGVAIQCNMTDEDVIRRLQQTVGAGSVRGPILKKTQTGTVGKPQWLWYLGRRGGAELLMEDLLPHMGTRRSARIREILAALAAHPPQVAKDHGTTYAYDRGCRCDECRAALAAKMRRYWAKKREGRPAKRLAHGTRNAYERRGCRCDDCLAFMVEVGRLSDLRAQEFRAARLAG